MTEFWTPDYVRIRIKKQPHSLEVAEFDMRVLVVGETLDVPARLATLLVVGGYAEPVSERSEADDSGPTRRKKR